jgi:hypothetical protein
MGPASGKQSRCHQRSRGGKSFLRRMKNEAVAQSASATDRRSMQAVAAKGIFGFPFLPFSFPQIGRRQDATCSFLPATFVPCRGIFRRRGVHLTNLGAAGKVPSRRASPERPTGLSTGKIKDRAVAQGTAEGGCPYMCARSPRVGF